MGCGDFFFTLLITFSTTLITYNILISANAPLKQELPGPSTRSSLIVDPIIKMPFERSSSGKKRLFHTAVTASDSVYNTWQCRVMYYWYMKHKDGPNSEMGGFTRILHSGKPDKFNGGNPNFYSAAFAFWDGSGFCSSFEIRLCLRFLIHVVDFQSSLKAVNLEN
ncbi:PEPTIDYL SERINE ALPHA-GALACTOSYLTRANSFERASE [Salix viminalis]|uniref:PEPTIDYL SERINE ALPHA-GALACTOSYLTRANSFERASE n=1 Tax=Salix viminalis TaxID=40686 RepID=A0A9Q0V859_SALVM|nr:PEPTIDYL SERINE ALPHA-GALACTOSYLTRANSFERASE [Salix viminalis]